MATDREYDWPVQVLAFAAANWTGEMNLHYNLDVVREEPMEGVVDSFVSKLYYEE